METNFSRRSFIAKSALASIGAGFALNGFASNDIIASEHVPPIESSAKISVFSKNLNWISDYHELAETALMMGFDGIDLTVRPNGHVLPENVKSDLPKAVEAIRKVGLEVYMITTSITDPYHQHTEPILKAANALGIQRYRTGWLNYEKKLSIPQNLQAFRKIFSDLTVLNQKYKIQGNYQNHSGLNLGSSIWDLWLVLKELDPKWMACQYDIRHATLEATNSWEVGLELLKSNIGSLDIKDFSWKNANGKWEVENVPLGKGMVNFQKYFSLLREFKINCPYSIHYEYPLGGAEDGAKSISIPKQTVVAAMKQDLDQLRKWLS